MGLSLRTGLDGEDEFYDDGEATLGGTTGITFGDSRRSATSDGNAGESAAFDFMSLSRSTLPDTAASILDLLSDNPRADSVSRSMEASRALANPTGDDTKEDNVISRVFSRVSKELGKEFDKDPLSFLKLGLGTAGGLYLSDEKRKAADAEQRSRIEQQQNAAAIKQAEIKRINDARKKVYRPPVGQKPLTRVDGTPIYTNGVIKG